MNLCAAVALSGARIATASGRAQRRISSSAIHCWMPRLAWRKPPADPIQCGRLNRVSSRGGDEHAEACAWFERYLDVLGMEHTYEPDLGTIKKPDYLVMTPTGPVVCEVKAFSPQLMPSAGFY